MAGAGHYVQVALRIVRRLSKHLLEEVLLAWYHQELQDGWGAMYSGHHLLVAPCTHALTVDTHHAVSCTKAREVSGGAWSHVLDEDGVQGIEGGQRHGCFNMVTQQLLLWSGGVRQVKVLQYRGVRRRTVAVKMIMAR